MSFTQRTNFDESIYYDDDGLAVNTTTNITDDDIVVSSSAGSWRTHLNLNDHRDLQHLPREHLLDGNDKEGTSRNLAIIAIIPPPGVNASTYDCTNNPNCTIITDEELADNGYSTVIGITVTQYYGPQYTDNFYNSTPVQLETKFYEGEAAAETAMGNMTLTLTMQNEEEEAYNVDPVEEVRVACYPSKFAYTQSVTCSNGYNTTIVCEGDYFFGYRVVQCPGYTNVAKCATFNGVDYEIEQRCIATSYDEYSTTCECNLLAYEEEEEASDDIDRKLADVGGVDRISNVAYDEQLEWTKLAQTAGSRRMTNSEGNVLSWQFTSFMMVERTNFASYYSASGFRVIEEVKYNFVVAGMVGVMMLLLFIGFFAFVRWDVRDVYTYDPRYNESKTIIPTMRTFDSFFDGVLPYEFSNTAWYERFWRKLLEEHDWLVMLTPKNYDEHRDLRTSKWLMGIGKLLHYMFAATILAQIFYMDDGKCQRYLKDDTCLAPKGIDGFSHMCLWVPAERSCRFYPFEGRLFVPSLAATMLIVLIIAFPEKLHRFLVQQTKRYFDRVYFGEGAELTMDNELGDEMKDIQHRAPTILRAARLQRMREEVDFVTPEQELTNLLKVTSRFHWFPQKQFTTATNNLMLALEQKMRNFQFNANEIGDAREASQLFYHSGKDLIVSKLQRSRRRAENMKRRMTEIQLDMDKDTYMVRRFLVDSLPGYRRLVAKHFFFARDEEGSTCEGSLYGCLSAAPSCLWFIG